MARVERTGDGGFRARFWSPLQGAKSDARPARARMNPRRSARSLRTI